MNILIIDSKSGVFDAPCSNGEKTFCRLANDCFLRHIALAKYFSERGDNVLLIRAEFSDGGGECFEYRDENGIPELLIKPQISKNRRKTNFKALFDFSVLLYENAPGIAGLFKPDVIIAGSFLPFEGSAAAKMARLSGSVLITELWCSPRQLLNRLRIFLPLCIGEFMLRTSIFALFRRSDRVFGFYPKAAANFPEKRNLVPFTSPCPDEAKKCSKAAADLRASLSALADDGIFTLCYCGEIEKGRALESLIAAVSGFDQKVELFIIGSGEYTAALKKAVRDNGIKNITFCEPVPKADAPFVLSAAKAVFYSENSFLSGAVSESEDVFRVLLSARPVIAVADTNAELLRKSGGAVLVPPGEHSGIALAIATLRSIPESDRIIMGEHGREFALLHSEQNYFQNYRKLLDELVIQKEN